MQIGNGKREGIARGVLLDHMPVSCTPERVRSDGTLTEQDMCGKTNTVQGGLREISPDFQGPSRLVYA